ncbi:MAG TPA: apolipoprotein N-acyltransferase, partial [Candidatus Limnocylindria bacterium]|nr:apolipoprotein N-acyltransferase [Candidatus Limnocylindria bacterium]
AAATARTPPVTVAVVQGGLADYARLREAHGSFEATRRILNRYFALSGEAAEGAQLLVWPETVYPTTFGRPKSEDGATFDRALARFVSSVGMPLVFGGYDAAEDGVEYNAAIVLEPAGAGGSVTFDAYRKTWLFPLTERVPALLDRPAVRAWLPWLGTWQRGDGPLVLSVRPKNGAPIRIVPLVCYDAVVPAHTRAAALDGGELIVTLSNDAWFRRGPGTWLHLAASVFRTIETHRPQVRATTTGISAVIDASGELRRTAGPGERAVLVEPVVPLALPPTVSMRLGDWVSPALSLAALLALAAGGHQRSGSTQNAPSLKPAGATSKTRLKRARYSFRSGGDPAAAARIGPLLCRRQSRCPVKEAADGAASASASSSSLAASEPAGYAGSRSR